MSKKFCGKVEGTRIAEGKNNRRVGLWKNNKKLRLLLTILFKNFFKKLNKKYKLIFSCHNICELRNTTIIYSKF